MNDTAVKLTSAEFDPSSKGRYHLSIGLADRSVSFALLDVASKNYVAYFGSTAFDPHALGDTFRTAVGSFLLGVEPISVSAFVKGGSATLVPSGSFDESQAHHHLALTQSSKLNTGVLHETIPALDVEMLYAQDPELSNALFKQFPQCKTLDARTVFLNASARKPSSGLQQQIHLQVWENEIDLAVFDHGELKLFNSHFFSSAEDILYHCVFALDRTEMDRDQISIMISGSVDANGELVELLSKYFRSPILKEAYGLLDRADVVAQRDYHKDHLLFELFQCA